MVELMRHGCFGVMRVVMLMRRRWLDWLSLGSGSARRGGVIKFLNLSYNNSVNGKMFSLLIVKASGEQGGVEGGDGDVTDI